MPIDLLISLEILMTDYIIGGRPVFYGLIFVEQAVTLCKRNHGRQTRIDLQEQMAPRLPRGFVEHTRICIYMYIYIYIYIYIFAVFTRAAEVTSNLYTKTEMSDVSEDKNLMTFSSGIDCRPQVPSHISVRKWNSASVI
jgi:hypothetical protein